MWIISREFEFCLMFPCTVRGRQVLCSPKIDSRPWAEYPGAERSRSDVFYLNADGWTCDAEWSVFLYFAYQHIALVFAGVTTVGTAKTTKCGVWCACQNGRIWDLCRIFFWETLDLGKHQRDNLLGISESSLNQKSQTPTSYTVPTLVCPFVWDNGLTREQSMPGGCCYVLYH